MVPSVSVLTRFDCLTVPAIAFLFNLLGTVKEQIGRNTKLHALLPKKTRQRPTVLKIFMLFQMITEKDECAESYV